MAEKTVEETLDELEECFAAWEPDARLVGNVRAGDALRAIRIIRGKQPRYAFCESNAAIRWHIRETGEKGLMHGGGADTPSLCGLEVAWDLEVPFKEDFDVHVCTSCAAAYREEHA